MPVRREIRTISIATGFSQQSNGTIPKGPPLECSRSLGNKAVL